MTAGVSSERDVAAALAALQPDALLSGLQAAVRVASTTGHEREVLELLAAQAEALGLVPTLVEHDLAVLRAHPDHPGEEAPRAELLGLRVDLPGACAGRPRLALCGHVDVVGPGTVPWADGTPWSGVVRGGELHGRGSADMKAGVLAALHALGALHASDADLACAPSLLAVASEEDGGLGAFAALEHDAEWAACVITEPTGFDVVCAQAGSLTFTGTVHGVSAHAAHRLEGVSAIDCYLPVHRALHALEAELNADVAHPLMAGLELAYPVLVGRIEGGLWSSMVPDRLEFEGRAPVRIGEAVADARVAVERAVRDAAPPGQVELGWSGGQFAPADTAVDAPLAVLAQRAAVAEHPGGGAFAGVPWGADMRLFTARGIPTVMCGPRGIERAHGVDERVMVADVVTTARILVRIACGFEGALT